MDTQIQRKEKAHKPKDLVIGNGRYTIKKQQKFGEGTFGDVYLGIDNQIETSKLDDQRSKTVAIKRFKSNSTFKDIESEFNLIKDISHPNLLKYRDLVKGDTENGPHYLVFDKYPSTLFQLIQTRPISKDDPRLKNIIKSLLTGTQYLHSLNLIHRDIKPANILIDGDNVLLADFGSICNPGDKNICGTINFMSPNLKSGLGASFKSDFYSIGATLMEVITGQQFLTKVTNESKGTIINKELHCELAKLEINTCKGLLDILNCLFSQDMDNPQKVDELIHHPWLNPQPDKNNNNSNGDLYDTPMDFVMDPSVGDCRDNAITLVNYLYFFDSLESTSIIQFDMSTKTFNRLDPGIFKSPRNWSSSKPLEINNHQHKYLYIFGGEGDEHSNDLNSANTMERYDLKQPNTPSKVFKLERTRGKFISRTYDFDRYIYLIKNGYIDKFDTSTEKIEAFGNISNMFGKKSSGTRIVFHRDGSSSQIFVQLKYCSVLISFSLDESSPKYRMEDHIFSNSILERCRGPLYDGAEYLYYFENREPFIIYRIDLKQKPYTLVPFFQAGKKLRALYACLKTRIAHLYQPQEKQVYLLSIDNPTKLIPFEFKVDQIDMKMAVLYNTKK